MVDSLTLHAGAALLPYTVISVKIRSAREYSVAAVARASRARAARCKRNESCGSTARRVFTGFLPPPKGRPNHLGSASSMCPAVRAEFVQRMSQLHDEGQDSRILLGPVGNGAISAGVGRRQWRR
jgi:hypothetical protein